MATSLRAIRSVSMAARFLVLLSRAAMSRARSSDALVVASSAPSPVHYRRWKSLRHLRVTPTADTPAPSLDARCSRTDMSVPG